MESFFLGVEEWGGGQERGVGGGEYHLMSAVGYTNIALPHLCYPTCCHFSGGYIIISDAQLQ